MVYPILSKNMSNIVRFQSPCQRKKICKSRKSRILRKPPDILGLIPAIDEDRPMQPLKNRDGKAKKIEKRGVHGLHPKHLIIVPCPKSQKKNTERENKIPMRSFTKGNTTACAFLRIRTICPTTAVIFPPRLHSIMFISLPDVPFCSTHQNPFSACPEARLMGEWEHKKKKEKIQRSPRSKRPIAAIVQAHLQFTPGLAVQRNSKKRA